MWYINRTEMVKLKMLLGVIIMFDYKGYHFYGKHEFMNGNAHMSHNGPFAHTPFALHQSLTSPLSTISGFMNGRAKTRLNISGYMFRKSKYKTLLKRHQLIINCNLRVLRDSH